MSGKRVLKLLAAQFAQSEATPHPTDVRSPGVTWGQQASGKSVVPEIVLMTTCTHPGG